MKNLVVVRGGGEIASGIVHRLHNTGYRVLVLETPSPSAIHREVSFSEAVYDGQKTVERVTCIRANHVDEAKKILKQGQVALLVDRDGHALEKIKPMVLVDAIMAKKNLGTSKKMAEYTIAIGPGFCAGADVNCVIETMPGHNFGRIIYEGRTMKNQEAPSTVGAVLRSSAAGRIENERTIASLVREGEVIARIYGEDEKITEIKAPAEGVICGLIRDGYQVSEGLRILDIAPRTEQENCFIFSDRDRCISGSVLEAVMVWQRKRERRRFIKIGR